MRYFPQTAGKVALSLWLLDLATKAWAGSLRPLPLIPGWLTLELHRNTGIAFSVPVPLLVQVAGSLAILAFLIKTAGRPPAFLKNPWGARALGAVLGGGAGNLFSRMGHGAVTDFIALRFFPVFNVADLAITAGLLAMACLWYSAERKMQRKK